MQRHTLKWAFQDVDDTPKEALRVFVASLYALYPATVLDYIRSAAKQNEEFKARVPEFLAHLPLHPHLLSAMDGGEVLGVLLMYVS